MAVTIHRGFYEVFGRVAAFVLLMASCVPAQPGSAPWKRHTIDNSSRGADGVRLADVNSDGRMDIATGWEEGGITRIYTHPGVEKVREPWPAETVGKSPNVEDAVWSDLDNDGKLDVVSSCEGKTRKLLVHWQQADGWKTEELAAPKQQWMFALPLQVDYENGVDLVVGSKGDGSAVGWLESPEDPRDVAAWKYHRWVDAGWIMSLRAVGVNLDGDVDVVFSDRKGLSSGVHWLANATRYRVRGEEELDWPVHEIGALGKQVLFLDVSDDGKFGDVEIAAAVRDEGVYVFKREGGEVEWTKSRIPWPAGSGSEKAVAIGDIDLDGKNDIVISCESAKNRKGVQWLKRIDDGNWTARDIAGLAGTKFDRLELIDLDEDGDLDVVTCEERENLGVIWYENPTR